MGSACTEVTCGAHLTGAKLSSTTCTDLWAEPLFDSKPPFAKTQSSKGNLIRVLEWGLNPSEAETNHGGASGKKQ